MADWKTYAKAARNTARKQAPEARDAARRASDRAGGYVRAAGKAIDEGRRPDDEARMDEARRPQSPRPEARRTQEPQRAEEPGRTGETRTSDEPRRPAQDPPPRRAPRTGDSERLAKDAAAYYTVAKRRVDSVNLIPRILRSLRDALLIGVSLIAIWAVLAAAGIPIPFTTVLIVVAAIVAVSFGVGVYAQWKRSREALDAVEDPRDHGPETDAR